MLKFVGRVSLANVLRAGLALGWAGCGDSGGGADLAAGGDSGQGAAAMGEGTGSGDAAAASLLSCPMNELAFKMVDLGEVSLNVGCQGVGPTLLLLHGFPEFSQSWSRFVPPLVMAGYRVVVPDQRGFNLSDKPAEIESYQIDRLVEDVVGLVAASGEEKVTIMAHDWGGTVAWVFAHRHSELLRGLVVMAGPHPDVWGRPEVDAAQAMASAIYVPLVAANSDVARFQAVFDLQLSPYLTSDELVLHHSAWAQPGANAGMRAWYGANIHPNVTFPINVTVDIPVLLTWGMNDPFTLPSQIEHIRARVENLTVHVWPDADHWLLFQKVDETVKLVTAFEKDLPR